MKDNYLVVRQESGEYVIKGSFGSYSGAKEFADAMTSEDLYPTYIFVAASVVNARVELNSTPLLKGM